MDIRTAHLEDGASLSRDFVRELASDVDAATTPDVLPHQVWESLDPRSHRQVRVVAVGDTHAEVEHVETEKRTRIRLAAFCGRGNKGYRFVGS